MEASLSSRILLVSAHIHVSLEWAPALFTACVTVRVTLCAVLPDTESVEWERESSPSHLAVVLIGWALLTGCWQSTSRRQVLRFSPPFHLWGFREKIFLWGVPPTLLVFRAWKKNLKWCPLTGYEACCFSGVWLQKEQKGWWRMGGGLEIGQP